MLRVLKWIGIVVGSLIGLLLVTGAVLYFIGNTRLNKTYDFPPSNIVVPTDAESIEYGRHRAEALCQGCHGPDMSGVEGWFNAAPIGRIDSANLTPGEGGISADFSTEDYVRAIRHGIDREGKPIFMVAVVSTAHLSDEDLGAIIAYLKTLPPVDHMVGEKQFTPLGKIMLAAGMLGQLPVESVSHEVKIAAPERSVTPEYGEYLVNTHDCRVCHGPNLNGAPYPDPTITKISPNLTPGGELVAWTEDDFLHTIRTGTTPSGHQMDPALMPWKDFAKFNDEELKAVWSYLQSLPSLPQYTE